MPTHNDMAAMLDELEFDDDRPTFYLLNVGETHYPYALPDEDPSEWPRISRRARRLQAPRRRPRARRRRRARVLRPDAACASCTTARSTRSRYLDGVFARLFDLLPVEHLGDRHLRPRRAVRRGPLLRPRPDHAREGARGAVRRGDGPVSERPADRARHARGATRWSRSARRRARRRRSRSWRARRGGGAHAHSAACWTLPSHAAMFTGLLPRAAGLARRRRRARRTAAGRSCEGTATACCPRCSGAPATRPRRQREPLDRRARAASTPGSTAGARSSPRARPGCTTRRGARGARWALEAVRARVDDGAGAARATMPGWVGERRADEPFFWFVNLNECHSPYLPPRPYTDVGAARAAARRRRGAALPDAGGDLAGVRGRPGRAGGGARADAPPVRALGAADGRLARRRARGAGRARACSTTRSWS